jgi:hypothetical protein
MNFYDSPEAEKLKKMIADKKVYASTVENKFAYQKIQKEILILEKEILPVVFYDTNIIHSEIARYAVKALETAFKYKCNGLLVYFPISDQYTDRPIVGVANPRSLLPFRTPGSMEISIDNMDGFGVAVRPINLPLNELI